MHAALATHWPLFGLRVTTPRIELRSLTDELAAELADVAALGIHDPSYMPFALPWTDVAPPDQQRNTLQWYWRSRAELTADHWHVPFAALRDGAVIGSISVMADNFATLRSFETGSWLGREWQGHGFGKEMRRAALHLGFAGLGAEVATTGAFVDNHASLGVTRSLGYSQVGTRRQVRRGAPVTMVGFELSRQAWQLHAGDDIDLFGVEACLAMLGAT